MKMKDKLMNMGKKGGMNLLIYGVPLGIGGLLIAGGIAGIVAGAGTFGATAAVGIVAVLGGLTVMGAVAGWSIYRAYRKRKIKKNLGQVQQIHRETFAVGIQHIDINTPQPPRKTENKKRSKTNKNLIQRDATSHEVIVRIGNDMNDIYHEKDKKQPSNQLSVENDNLHKLK